MHKMFCELQLLALDFLGGRLNFCLIAHFPKHICIFERHLLIEFHKDDICICYWFDRTVPGAEKFTKWYISRFISTTFMWTKRSYNFSALTQHYDSTIGSVAEPPTDGHTKSVAVYSENNLIVIIDIVLTDCVMYNIYACNWSDPLFPIWHYLICPFVCCHWILRWNKGAYKNA